MSTNWSGVERKSRAPITLTEPVQEEAYEAAEVHQDATAPAVIRAVPDANADVPVQPAREETEHGPLVSGRRSASVLRKENVNDQLPPVWLCQVVLGPL